MTFKENVAEIFLAKFLQNQTLHDHDSSLKDIKQDAQNIAEVVQIYTKFFYEAFETSPAIASIKLGQEDHLEF